MKTLLILLLTATTLQAQGVEHEILTGQLSTAVNGHELFVQDQDKRITILQIDVESKLHFFSAVNTFVNSHDDVKFFRKWVQHSEHKNIYMSSLVVNKFLFVLYYSHNLKRLIIRSIDIKIE